MSQIHLVYPHGPSISCPQAIGRKLIERLCGRYEVVPHEWNEVASIVPSTGDVLVGHPHPALGTIFGRSASNSGWRRVIMLSPYTHDQKNVAFIDTIIRHCDLYLAITGNYWYSSTPTSLFSHWLPKMVHVDLAVDRNDFPPIKTEFGPPGQRRFVYIGHTGWYKNTRYLSDLVGKAPGLQVSWIGRGREPIPGLTPMGSQDFASSQGKKCVAQHDFLITVGKADANPTTILEAMAWGLIPVCTPQSGYAGYSGIINIPLGNTAEAVAILTQLQYMPESRLHEIQAENWKALDDHFNWDRFAGQVIAAIDSDVSPELGAETLQRRLRLRAAALTSPFSIFSFSNVRTSARALVGR